ncbi:c-type cytochrome [Microvirga roseola]|uniref:c-type cytochrome n=1 Tax=Microvirga roseola TaxID=2883126 RepID=UPI001E57AFD6|nr:c-type cytochrome [Microvirga roseola]
MQNSETVATGRAAIEMHGCGSCHRIPGIGQADGNVGPPLTHLPKQSYVAGKLPNTFPNLVTWIVNPRAINPDTAMPVLGVSPDEAAAIAAYLYAEGEGG